MLVFYGKVFFSKKSSKFIFKKQKKWIKKKTAKNGKIYTMMRITDINNNYHMLYVKMLL